MKFCPECKRETLYKAEINGVLQWYCVNENCKATFDIYWEVPC